MFVVFIDISVRTYRFAMQSNVSASFFLTHPLMDFLSLILCGVFAVAAYVLYMQWVHPTLRTWLRETAPVKAWQYVAAFVQRKRDWQLIIEAGYYVERADVDQVQYDAALGIRARAVNDTWGKFIHRRPGKAS